MSKAEHLCHKGLDASAARAEAELRRVCAAIAARNGLSEALIIEGFELVLDAVERFSRPKRYPWQEDAAFNLGMKVLVKCASRYDPARGPFSHYLRATIWHEFKRLKRKVISLNALSRYGKDGEEIVFEPREDLAALEFPGYTEAERKIALSVYEKLMKEEPELAQVLRWSAVDGVSLREIGRRMGRSHKTAWQRKQEARKRIKQLLDGMGGRQRRQPRPRDWGQTMVDPQVVRYLDDNFKVPSSGWTHQLLGDNWDKRRRPPWSKRQRKRVR